MTAKAAQIELKRNVPGYTDEQGRFRPIRSAQYVGSGSYRRTARKKDRAKYSRVKAGDLGKARQARALEDPWDRELRLEREEKEKAKRSEARILREIERDVYNEYASKRKPRTLAQFVRSEGGLKRTKAESGELDLLKGSRLVTLRPGKGKDLDRMFQAAREAGYDVEDQWDMLDRIDTEIKGGGATYATHGYLAHNPASGIGETILQQLGGRQFIAMTGARVGSAGKTLYITLPRVANTVKFVTITLQPNDLYTVECFNSRGGRFGGKLTDVFSSQLRSIFEERTGLTTSLTERHNPKRAKAKKNPDLLTTFATLAGGLASTLHIEDIMEKRKARTARQKEHTKSVTNPSNIVYVIWGHPVGEPDWVETPIEEISEKPTAVGLAKFKQHPAIKGKFDRIRVQKLDLFVPPDFTKTLRNPTRRNDIEIAYQIYAGRRLLWEHAGDSERDAIKNAQEYLHGLRPGVTPPVMKIRRIERDLHDGVHRLDRIDRFGPYITVNPAPAPKVKAKDKRHFPAGSKFWRFDGKTKTLRKARTFSIGKGYNGLETARIDGLIWYLGDIRGGKVVMNPAPAPKVKAKGGILYMLTIGNADDTIGVYLHDGKKDGFDKHFKTIPAAKAWATRNKITVIDNPLFGSVKDAIGRRWARSKATRAYSRELQLEDKLKKTRAKRSAAERRAKNPVAVWPGKYYVISLSAKPEKHGRIRDFSTKQSAMRNARALLLKDNREALGIDGVQVLDANRKVLWQKRVNPVQIPRRRTYEMFQGRQAETAERLGVSRHAPARMDQLGDLVELKLNSGRVLKFDKGKFRLCAAGGKLWIAGGKFAKANPSGAANEINPIDKIDHVVYGTRKPHHGDHAYTHYIHRLGEETGHRPTLCVDKEGYPVIRGGQYKIEARGIVN